jgi:hypothetical protein
LSAAVELIVDSWYLIFAIQSPTRNSPLPTPNSTRD